MQRGAFLFPALGVAVLLGFVVSEKLTAAPPPDKKIHLAYWEKWTDFEFDAMKAVVDAFNKKQDRIQVDILSVSGIEDKTLMAIAGGIPPDIAGLYGANAAQYADDNAVIPLDDYAREAGITRDRYIEGFYDQGVIRGKLYSLPSAPATVALHYNKAMFRKAGLDADKPPQTTEELVAMADKMTVKNEKGHLKTSGFLPTEPGWWNWFWCPMFGGRLWDGVSKITINEPASVRGFAWAQSFAKKYGAGEISTQKGGFGNFSSPQNGFLAEQLGMELQGVWMYNFIHKFAPKLEWNAVPFPHPADRPDLNEPTVIDEDILCIPRGAKHPKEAFEFINYVQSQEGMELLCMGQKKLSPLKKVSPEFMTKHPNPFIKLFTRLAYGKNAYATPKLGIWKEYNDEINSTFDTIMLMQKTPQQALDDLAKRMQPKLDTYLRRLHERGEL